jgi:hypothetical protein
MTESTAYIWGCQACDEVFTIDDMCGDCGYCNMCCICIQEEDRI